MPTDPKDGRQSEGFERFESFEDSRGRNPTATPTVVSPSQARGMSPKQAADFLRQFPQDVQMQEIRHMISAGGHVTNLAHGIAIYLGLDKIEDIDDALRHSLKMSYKDLGMDYAGQAARNASERSQFADKGPMYARMQQPSVKTTNTDDDEIIPKPPAR